MKKLMTPSKSFASRSQIAVPVCLALSAEAVRILHQPEAEEQDDEEDDTLLQHAGHRVLLASGEGWSTPKLTRTPHLCTKIAPRFGWSGAPASRLSSSRSAAA